MRAWAGVACHAGRVIVLDLIGLHCTRLGHLALSFAFDGLRNLTCLEAFNAFGFSGPILSRLGARLAPTFRSFDISALTGLANLTTLALPANARVVDSLLARSKVGYVEQSRFLVTFLAKR